jgi:hypothetical protein
MPTIFKHKVVSNTVAFNDVLPSGAGMFGVDVLDGWKDTGDPEESAVELGSYRDGSVSSSYFPIRSKFVTIGGYVVAGSVADAEDLSDVLVRDAFPRNRFFSLSRYEAVPKQMVVKRTSAIEFDWSVVENGFRWTTTLMAEDPFKYALTSQVVSAGTVGVNSSGHTFPVTFPMTFGTGSTSSGGAGVVNEGTAASSNFVADISGNLTKGAWRLSNDTTGDFIGFNTAVGASDDLIVDFQNQIATLNGAVISSDYTGSFWKLIPGVNIIRLYAEFDPSAGFTITAYSAWE